MHKLDRVNPLALVAAAAMGGAIALVVQFALSSRGNPPFVPPLSLPSTLVLLAVVLLVLGVRLRRALTKQGRQVNPFHAVRLLATARAGQFVGALLGGAGAGLALALLGRSVPAPTATWLPMILTLATGAVLVAAGAVTEHLCRVPPGDGDEEDGESPDPSPGPADRPAYRTDRGRHPNSP
ncbi:MAG: DUF3180 family protein [Leucobacter sp.]